MWVIYGKCESVLASKGDLAYIGEPLITVTVNSILDLGRRPRTVSDILY